MRGDLDLIVKQHSLTGFDFKLTRRRARLSVPTINWVMAGSLCECYDYFGVGKRHCRVLSVVVVPLRSSGVQPELI